ncbi:MAG: DUF262 domain-containing protein [Rhodospirillales bacterium]|nr:DUF262 domain-containing protein [Rhodospirillales bacterium]
MGEDVQVASNAGEVDDFDEAAEVIQTEYSITSYGADYPVDGLVKRLGQGDIIIPLFNLEPEPGQSTVGFQREFVWKKSQCDRFIESLLLGLPVPGIFLVKESNGKHLVLDGQQRLRTLQQFYEGLFQGIEFTLDNVQNKWKGKTYKTLHPDDRRRLDDSIIHAIVVRQDEPSEDQSSIYLIFERLNSGGTLLQPQEIRVALYHGQFAGLLSELNSNEKWRNLYGRKSSRLKDLELILRFFAFYFESNIYRRPMKEFLNNFMASNKNCTKYSNEILSNLFNKTIDLIHDNIGPRAFRLRNAVNAALLDSIMVGIAVRLNNGPDIVLNDLGQSYQNLLKDLDYIKVVEKSTADEENVKMRLQLAIKYFS